MFAGLNPPNMAGSYDYSVPDVQKQLYEPSTNPFILLIVIGVITVFLICFSAFQNREGQANVGRGLKTVQIIFFAIVVFLVLAIGLRNLLGIEIVGSIKNLFSPEPEVDLKVLSKSNNDIEEKMPKQVFNIPQNKYNYEDSKALCKAFGAELASFNQIEKAYKGGAEWCNFGWSEGQMALYPTQKDTYERLQEIEGHEHDCGRPGINGGYIDNPNAKFGVNCFGYKPKMNADEQDILARGQMYPKTKDDINMEKRVDHWKKNIKNILISPFNHDNWSRI